MRVINRLPPLPHESLESLLARLGAANRYLNQSWYLPLPGPPAPRDPNKLRHPAHLNALGEMLGLDPGEVRELTLGRFESCFTSGPRQTSGERRAGATEVAGSMRIDRSGWYAHGEGKGQVCRECARQSEALMLPWFLRVVTACPVHLVVLSERHGGDASGDEPAPVALIAEDARGIALTRLVWSAIGCGESFPPPGLRRETVNLVGVMGASGLLTFLWRMGGLLLRHDRGNPALRTIRLGARDMRSLRAGETHIVLSTVAGLLLDWPLSWYETLDGIAEGELEHPRNHLSFPLALASAFRGSDWRWLHRSWDEFIEERARSRPTPGVYAWLHRHYIPRSQEVPSLELRAPAPSCGDSTGVRARLLEAPRYRPLPAPPWQLEEEASSKTQGLRSDAVLSLREAARHLGTMSAHVASLAAAGILATESGPTSGGGDAWSFRGAALTEFLARLPVSPIPERGIEHPVSLKQAMEMLSEVGVSLAQMVVAMKAGRLQQGRLTVFCAYPSPTLGRLWFSRRQVCEYLWYRREPIERDRLLPVDRLAKRYGMETLRLWYATGLLAPCRDRTDAKRIRWWYDDWEVSYRREQGQLPERLGPGIDLSNTYLWEPDDVLEWRDRWYDSIQALRYLDWCGVHGADEGRLAEWVSKGRLSCQVEFGLEAGAVVRWYPREEVEELQRQLYIERHDSGQVNRSGL